MPRTQPATVTEPDENQLLGDDGNGDAAPDGAADDNSPVSLADFKALRKELNDTRSELGRVRASQTRTADSSMAPRQPSYAPAAPVVDNEVDPYEALQLGRKGFFDAIVGPELEGRYVSMNQANAALMAMEDRAVKRAVFLMGDSARQNPIYQRLHQQKQVELANEDPSLLSDYGVLLQKAEEAVKSELAAITGARAPAATQTPPAKPVAPRATQTVDGAGSSPGRPAKATLPSDEQINDDYGALMNQIHDETLYGEQAGDEPTEK